MAHVETSMAPHWLINEIQTLWPSNLGLAFSSSYYFQPYLQLFPLHTFWTAASECSPNKPNAYSSALNFPLPSTPFPALNPTCPLSLDSDASSALPDLPHQEYSLALCLRPLRTSSLLSSRVCVSWGQLCAFSWITATWGHDSFLLHLWQIYRVKPRAFPKSQAQ